jgi:hypothetical protein
MGKIGSLSVKTGEYQQDGQTKGRYENIGTLMQGDDGGFYVILKKTFNPAGVNQGDGKDSIIVSCYAEQQNQGGNQQQGGGQQQQQQNQQQQNYGQPQQNQGQQQYQQNQGGGHGHH